MIMPTIDEDKILQLANPPKITYSENGSYRKEAAAFEIDANEPKCVCFKKKLYFIDSLSFSGEVLVKTQRVENEG